MHFSHSAFALAAMASGAYAQIAGFDAITNPSKADETLTPGSTFDITWQAATFNGDKDTVTIYLLAGNDPSSLNPTSSPLAASIKNSDEKYTWTVPSSTAPTYGFKIQLDANTTTFQYSQPFHISGGTSSSSASGSSSTTSAVNSKDVKSTASATSSKATSAPSSANSSTGTVVVSQTSDGQVTVSTTLPAGNLSTTLATSTAAGATQTVGASSSGSGSASATTSQPASTTGSSGASLNMAQGGLALVGGLVIALAL